MTSRRTCLRADVVAQRPSALFQRIPGPQFCRTCVTMPSCLASCGRGKAWADVARVKAKTIAINLIMLRAPLIPPEVLGVLIKLGSDQTPEAHAFRVGAGRGFGTRCHSVGWTSHTDVRCGRRRVYSYQLICGRQFVGRSIAANQTAFVGLFSDAVVDRLSWYPVDILSSGHCLQTPCNAGIL